MASRTLKTGGKLKTGGRTKQEYNAVGSQAMKAADDEEPGFKKGGKAKEGMKAEGKDAKMRGDKKPRAKRASGGRTPYSTGSKTSSPSSTNSGHESERPSEA